MKIGYIRVSCEEQNEQRQTELLQAHGVEKIFDEKISGKTRDRKELQEALDYCRNGDVFMVCDLSRLARNTRDLLNIVHLLEEKGASFVSLKENIDFSTATGKLIFNMLSSIYEFERTIMLERQREGILIAKRNGVYKGRKAVAEPSNFTTFVDKINKKEITAVEAMRQSGLKKSTFYRFLRKYKVDRMGVE